MEAWSITRVLSPRELREKFNDEGHWSDAVDGNLTCCWRRKGKPSSDDEPPGSVSYIIDCFNPDDTLRFRAHCYVRTTTDGIETFGGSGLRLPDPKVIISDGIRFCLPRRLQQPDGR